MTLLERLRELDEKATPGPWVTDEPGLGRASVWRGRWFGLIASCETPSREENHEEDAELIAAARNALPAVVALIEAAQQLGEWNAIPSEDNPAAVSDLMYQLDVLAARVAPFVVSTQEAAA